MPEQIEGTYLCLLDDVSLSADITLDGFDVRYYSVDELIPLIIGSKGEFSSAEIHRLKSYSEFPWARMKPVFSPDKIKTDFDRILLTQDLAYKHAGMVCWEPFTELIRTLNLLKESTGPVIARQFYFTLHAKATMKADIGSVIYGEPDFVDMEKGEVRPRLLEFPLEQNDVAEFSTLRKQLKECLSKDSRLSNSHLRIAIHYFENGDRKLQPDVLPGSFNAIDPLMSYEAALEALVVPEKPEKGKTDENMASRVSSILDGKGGEELRNFLRRVFWLRSKVAHGARSVEEIESLIIDNANCAINDKARGQSIPEGNYKELILTGYEFPGFLVNLREITRRTIRFFCDEYLKDRPREETLEGV